MSDDYLLRPFSILVPTDIDQLRTRFLEVGYNQETFRQILPPFMRGDATLGGTFPTLRHLKTADPSLATLVCLFQGELPVAEADCRSALGDQLFNQLLASDFLFLSESGVASHFAISPCNGKLIIADRAIERLKAIDKNLVMSVGASSTTLSNATPRRPIRRALDIGCGSGVQSLQLAEHANEVIAVDINERALSFGRFAAKLNEVTNIEFRNSDFFSAVQGEKFDLIVANPPFVISPESTFHYRDGGLGGDRVTETVIRNAGAYLEEGGISITVCEFASTLHASAAERLQSWTQGNGCDVWVCCGDAVDPRQYALTWLQSNLSRMSMPEYAATYDQWVAHYDALGIQSMHTGLVVQRKRTGENWFYSDEAPEAMRGQWGATLLQMFDLLDNIKNSSLDELLDQPYKLAPQARMRNVLAQEGNRWGPLSAELFLEEPLTYSGRVDHHVAGLCARCDGTVTMRQLLAELAESLKISFEKLQGAVMPVLFGLFARGYLIPAALLSPSSDQAPSA